MTVRHGQAVWMPRAGAPEVAGEIVLARRGDGAVWVQFSKSPFPIITGKTQPEPASWQAEIPAQNRSFHGRGRPPARLVWLHLGPALLDNVPPPKPLRLEIQPGSNGPKAPLRWRFENSKTGESLEGYLNP